jgi:hypothetical protein
MVRHCGKISLWPDCSAAVKKVSIQLGEMRSGDEAFDFLEAGKIAE